ncbi:MAG: signal peptidase I [Candidatus Eisenbacteria bacterium]|uniref:Signal peptidase I n=1 Tax=Eiseniibacteriota bacterium TaxID=2212470 RepID=A0A956LWF5_UNCEI|nr:signal peptidase I [Candidatus Eisenbacteria bacterium]
MEIATGKLRQPTPWLAVVLSVLLIGLGHYYANRKARGVILWAVYIMGIYLLLGITGGKAPTGLFLLGWLYGLAVFLDAFRAARSSAPYRVSRWQTGPAYGLVVLLAFALHLCCFLWIRATSVQAFRIPTASMEPTILPGDSILVDKRAYGRGLLGKKRMTPHLPERGSLIVYEAPAGDLYLKRCVAVAGDTIEIHDKQVFLNGAVLSEPYVQHLDESRHPGRRDEMESVIVPEGHIFEMGDNRDFSFDARFSGPTPAKNVIGTVSKVYFSTDSETHRVRWERIGLVPS